MASKTNGVMHGPRPRGTAAQGGGGREEEMTDVEEMEAMGETEESTMSKSASTTAAETANEAETGALPFNH